MTLRQAGALTARANEWVERAAAWPATAAFALARYEPLGLEEPWVAAAVRALPLATIGITTAAAAIGVEHELMAETFALVAQSTSWPALRATRDEAIVDGLDLGDAGEELSAVVVQLPCIGRLSFTMRVDEQSSPDMDKTLRTWHALDCLNAWRTDTSHALIATAGLNSSEAAVLAAACRHETVDDTPAARSLATRSLLSEGRITASGAALHRQLIAHTERLAATPWELLGLERTAALIDHRDGDR